MSVTPEEVDRVRALVFRESSVVSDPPAISGWLQKMCRAAARDLPAAGVGLTLVNDKGTLITAASSAAAIALVEELQFTLGEGPCVQAYATRQPVLVPDLTRLARTTWSGYAPAAQEHGVRSVFAFPLQVGKACLGALDVYQREAGDLSPRALTSALAFTEVAMSGFLDSGAGDGLDSEPGRNPEGMKYAIYQAQGMVMVQLGITLADAMARLRAHAFASGRSLSDVADDVLKRRLFLEDDES
jgi:GAF domain-containing protein